MRSARRVRACSPWRSAWTPITRCSRELARAGGGASFRIDEAEQTTARALELASAVKLPTITDLEIDLGAGLDEPFTTATGKLSRGDEVAMLARTHHDIPPKVKVRGRLAGEAFEKKYDVAQRHKRHRRRSCPSSGPRSTCGACSAARRAPTPNAAASSRSASTTA